MNKSAISNILILSFFTSVLLHTSANYITQVEPQTTAFFFSNIYDTLTRWCFPALFMLSGYILLNSNEYKENIGSFYKNNIGKIVLTIIFWTIIFFIWRTIKFNFREEILPDDFFLRKLYLGTPHYNMWYLYVMVCLYLFTPFISKAMEAFNKQERYILIAILFGMSAVWQLFISSGYTDPGFFLFSFLPYIGYFVAGKYLLEDLKAINSSHRWMWIAGLLVTIAFGYYMSDTYNIFKHYAYKYLSLPVIPFSLLMFGGLVKLEKPLFGEDWTPKLAALATGVYLVHPVYIEILRKFVFKSPDFYPLVMIPLLFAVVLVISLITSYLISKIPVINKLVRI